MKTQNQESGLEEVKRYMGVLIEGVDSKLDLVLEGQEGLQKQITDVAEDLREFKEETNFNFGVVTETIKEMREDMDNKFEITFEELIRLGKRGSM